MVKPEGFDPGRKYGAVVHWYGGFMTLYALVHAPGVFRCGVAGSGPTYWS